MLGHDPRPPPARGRAAVTLIEAAAASAASPTPWRLGERDLGPALPRDPASPTAHPARSLNELGLEHESSGERTRTGFFADGQLLPLTSSLEFLRFRSARHVRQAATCRAPSCGRRGSATGAARKDRRSSDWLRRWSGDRTVRAHLASRCCGRSWAMPTADVSAAFIWATIRADVRRAPHGPQEGDVRATCGAATPASSAALRDRLGRRAWSYDLGRRSRQVARPLTRACVQTLSEHASRFDQVVLTMPGAARGPALPGPDGDERARLDGVDYQGIVCASVAPAPAARRRTTSPTSPTRRMPFTAVIEMSALTGTEGFRGPHARLPAEVRGPGRSAARALTTTRSRRASSRSCACLSRPGRSRGRRLPLRPGAPGLRPADARLPRPGAARGHDRPGSLSRELGPDGQRHAERRRDPRRAGERHAAPPGRCRAPPAAAVVHENRGARRCRSTSTTCGPT